MSNGDYHCFCTNKIDISNAIFRALDAAGHSTYKKELGSGESGSLQLVFETGNWIQVEYYDVNWQHVGCFTPVNSGDSVVVYGVSHDFEVTINDKKSPPLDCPGK